ncbi:MAG: hypothetical protein ACUVQ3_01925 [bacterium]
MKKILLFILTISALCSAGQMGIGFSAGGEYKNGYGLQNYGTLDNMFYGGEVHISAEALPFMFIEPIGLVVNDPTKSLNVPGIGLRINVAPRLGRFFLAPFFGIEGDILFYNSRIDLKNAVTSGRWEEYFEGSSPRAIGMGFGGISVYFGKAVSFNCQYRYMSLTKNLGVEMVWAGITYYINW